MRSSQEVLLVGSHILRELLSSGLIILLNLLLRLVKSLLLTLHNFLTLYWLLLVLLHRVWSGRIVTRVGNLAYTLSLVVPSTGLGEVGRWV